ncbi:MAG: polysaccharide deacetylase family protein [Candidatus Levybacteria bacterium]|nr:polysaccharide deacetylase family protein [Candidatus Levybacteria bacterium]
MSIKKKIFIVSFLIFYFALINGLNRYSKIFSVASKNEPASSVSTPIPLKSLHAPILIYHYVEYVQDEKDTIRKSLNILPHIFIKQIETLKNAGYTFITASELIDIMDGKINTPQKPILITFDDGYRDFYTDVFPILKKYNVKITAYIVSGFLDKLNYMFTWQLEEIAKSGLVEIGAHTVHHYALGGLNPILAKSEIEDSKKRLEELTNLSVVSFAYPNGSFDDPAQKLVKEAGFKSAVTTIHGLEVNENNKFSLYRIHPGNKTDDYLLNFIEQE